MQYIVEALFAAKTVVSALRTEPDSSPRAKSAKCDETEIGNDGYPSGFE